jgi:hypothetical protein
MGGACGMHRIDEKCVYKIVVGSPAGKRQFGRPWQR